MPIRVEHGGPGLAGLAGLLSGVGRSAITETEIRNRAQQSLAQFTQRNLEQDISLRSQESLQAQRLSSQRSLQIASDQVRRSMQVDSLNAQRASQRQQIQAQSQRDMQAADTAYKRMAVQAGLQGELKEQAFDLEIQRMEEEARQRASQRKAIVTEEGAKNQAAANRLLQIIEDPESPFSQGEKEQMKQKEVGLRNNVLTQVTDLTPKPPPEYALWSSGIMKDGTGRPYDVDGDGKRTIGSAKDTTAGIETERQHEIVLANMEAAQSLIDKRDSYWRLLQSKGEEYIDSETGEILKRPIDANEAARRAFEQYPAPVAPEQAAPAQERLVPPERVAPPEKIVPQAGQPGWQNSPGAANLIVYENDLRYPERVGFAIAYMRTILQKMASEGHSSNRKTWPKDTRETYERARSIVAREQGIR